MYRLSDIILGTHPDGKKSRVDQLREISGTTGGDGEKTGELNLMSKINTWGSFGLPATIAYGSLTIESMNYNKEVTNELLTSGFTLGAGLGFDFISGARGAVVFDKPVEGQTLKDVFDAAPFVTTKTVGALFKYVRLDAYTSRNMEEKIWHADLFGAGAATATFGGERSIVN